MPYFAEIIIPKALPQNYSYSIPEGHEKELMPGMRVVVPLGKRKLYTGVVKRIFSAESLEFTAKPILGREDKYPIILPEQFRFWEWIANYYLCSEGEVMTAAMPSGLKLESEMVVLRNPEKELIDEELNDTEYLVVEALQVQSKLSIKDLMEITNLKNPLFIIKELLSKQYLFLEEELKQGYTPRKKRMVSLTDKVKADQISESFELLGRSEKQRELLLAFFRYAGIGKNIVAATLLKKSNSNEAALKGLEKKGLVDIYYEEQDIFGPLPDLQPNLPELSEAQYQAKIEIENGWKSHDVCLFHGVTSSGKTEVYSHLLESVVHNNNQALYLVPEIALTTQLIQRLRVYFGDAVMVYHSRFSDRERVENWLELVKNPNKARLIVGARSSVFLPFSNLDLIIVDEEHENSFKQYDPSPRYHARDAAIVLASIHKSKVLLGSATPSFESYFNCKRNKYVLVNLNERYGNMPMPEILAVDMKEERKRKKLKGHFSEKLIHEIEVCIKSKKQVILFQNRRGFSTFIQCENCAHVVQCKDCDISMTYHRYRNHLRCHYCGYSTGVPHQCPACKSHQIKSLGFGTEKLEDDLSLMFPEIKVQRMDLDTTRKKKAYENIITAFEDGETDILVGTQMVTKGLDFANVGLVGIMNADTLLFFPDFRSHEKAFQMLAQVSGRAGRKGDRGKVIIQSSDPRHDVILKVQQNRYKSLYDKEIVERRDYKYPPFNRLIRITIRHREQAHLEQRANILAKMLRESFGNRIIGPEYPLANRLRGQYQMEMILKLENSIDRPKAKKVLLEQIINFEQAYPQKRLQVAFDVDPI
jgi:primosomal protein N' (replication factor Y)